MMLYSGFYINPIFMQIKFCYSLDEQRRKRGGHREKPKIELGAVLDTTCRKCGGKGSI